MPTLRQAPAEADIPSHRLLLRGGFIRPLSAGVFNFLPLGLRVLRKVENIVREEMDRAGAIEVLLPAMQPREVWERSGRWESFVPPLFKFQDRGERWFALGPTHEEVITDLVARDVTSYKQLPVNLYQIQVKFRNEPRPRAGLIRVREFIMKDAYSFDADRAGLDRSYEAMYEAYVRIFERMGMQTTVVEAEAGSIGGSDTREFMLLCESGEDTVFMCDECGYKANAECAEVRAARALKDHSDHGEPEVVETPGMTTIAAVSEFLGVTADQLVKTLIYATDEKLVAALVRGDRDLNEAKLRKALGAKDVRMATAEEIEQVTGGPVGYSGPVGLPDGTLIVADHEIGEMADFVVGANRGDAHLVGVNLERDFRVGQWADLRIAAPGDPCPRCEQGCLAGHRAIELGHIFKLGTKYSEAMGAFIDTEDGRQAPMVMGCYGIGVSRCVAAIVEANLDENGIVWPLSVAPFHVALLQVDPDEAAGKAAEGIALALEAAGYEVLWDDRDERAGVKFKDADLIGIPLQVVVGKKLANEGVVEVRRRRDREQRLVAPEEAPAAIAELAVSA
jgi:prolyl-tRNA synthetase